MTENFLKCIDITNINIINSKGESFLHIAIKYGIFEIVKYLVDNGADVNVSEGLALEYAHKFSTNEKRDEYLQITEYLLKNGKANPHLYINRLLANKK